MSEKAKKSILKVIVGSQAHGLSTPESDIDYRGVYVAPTSEILSLNSKYKGTHWIEGENEDNTSWELFHFLHLATHSNPTILETFLAPVEESTPEGDELRALFPYVWSSTNVMNAFIGYGLNQRKKFLERKDTRPAKYAAAHLRVLYNAWELLTTGTFTIKISDTPVGDDVRRFKTGQYTSAGDVIDKCIIWEDKVKSAYADNPNKQTEYEKINEFLLKVRQSNW